MVAPAIALHELARPVAELYHWKVSPVAFGSPDSPREKVPQVVPAEDTATGAVGIPAHAVGAIAPDGVQSKVSPDGIIAVVETSLNWT